jgi:ubiquitin-conjugating enzyme E2 Q
MIQDQTSQTFGCLIGLFAGLFLYLWFCRKSTALEAGVFSAELNNDNLFEWDVKLKKFDEESKLAEDLAHMKRVHGIADVWLRISFPPNYPFDPPFVRVLAPLVQGGYVLTGGAICMELLTPDGWSQAYTVEAVIMQTMATMIKGEARIAAHVKKDFSEAEARRAYDYLVKAHAKHGWNTPPKGDG